MRTKFFALIAALAITASALLPTDAKAKTPPPPAALANNAIDAHLGYLVQTTCSPSAKPGTSALLKLLIKTWGGSSSGISRGCGIGGRSEHKEGRALDWHMSVKNTKQRNRVDQALKWITTNNGEVALRLGVMYVIWNQHIWSVYYPELGWRKMAGRGSVTANHKDHVHISLSWDGAYQQTSWWTGKPIATPLNSACGRNGARTCLPVTARTTKAWPYQKTPVPSSFTPAPWVVPGVGGSPQVGRELRAVGGTWVPNGAAVSYQWLADGKAIPGATAANYLISPQQRGREVEVRVTATSGSSVITKTSNNSAEVYPGRMSAPTPKISGLSSPGSTLGVVLGTWNPVPTRFSYTWLRNGKKIKGASGSSYRVRKSDLKDKISVKVTGSRTGYSTRTLTSAKVKIRPRLAVRSGPSLNGNSVLGSTLSLSVAWTSTPTSVSYRWYAAGVAISGATGDRLVLGPSVVGKAVFVELTAKRSGYATTTLRSASVGPIKP